MRTSDLADADAFRDWARPHLRLMLDLARRLAQGDAEDVVQDALIVAWQRRDRFDETRGTPQAWLLTLTAHAAARARRTRTRHPWQLSDQPTDSAVIDIDPDLDLRRAVDALAPRQQLAVNLFYYLDRPVDEIAVVMGCSVGTVKSTLADARGRLRRHLEGT